MKDRIFVLANEEQANDYMVKAKEWINSDNQNKFQDDDSIKYFAIAVVAEYLANLKGFTMYPENAKYPKGDCNV